VRRRVPLAALVVSVTLAGCGGGSSGVSAEAYVKARCITLSAWKSAVQRAGTEIQAARPKTLQEGKSNYRRFVSRLLTATRHAESAMRAAGTPAVTDGSQIARALVAAFGNAARQLQQAAGHARAIPTNSTTAYAKAVGGLTTSISQMLTRMGSISPGNSTQLQAAAAKSPACKSLVS
jgi:hypothetical protein